MPQKSNLLSLEHFLAHRAAWSCTKHLFVIKSQLSKLQEVVSLINTQTVYFTGILIKCDAVVHV